jgi:hypothetical protein
MENFNLKKFLVENKLTTNSKTVNEENMHLASGSEEFNKLVKILQTAIQQAAQVGLDAKENPDNYEGSEGNDIHYFLQQIYNAFSTGNPKDNTYADEIFK